MLEDSRINLLKPSNDPFQDALGPEDFVGWLNPSCDPVMLRGSPSPCIAKTSFLAKRVVKIERFYFIFQVSDYHLIENQKGAMDSLPQLRRLPREGWPNRQVIRSDHHADEREGDNSLALSL